jgi:hypothetical protein
MAVAGGAGSAGGDRMLDPYAVLSDHHLFDDEADHLLPLLDVQRLGRSVEALEEVIDAVGDLQQRFFVDLLDCQ